MTMIMMGIEIWDEEFLPIYRKGFGYDEATLLGYGITTLAMSLSISLSVPCSTLS